MIVIEVPVSALPVVPDVALAAAIAGWLPEDEDRFRPVVPASR